MSVCVAEGKVTKISQTFLNAMQEIEHENTVCRQEEHDASSRLQFLERDGTINVI